MFSAAIWYYIDSPLILYNTEYKSGGVQKLSGAVFCTDRTAEKLTVLYQINRELVLYQITIDFIQYDCFFLFNYRKMFLSAACFQLRFGITRIFQKSKELLA